MPPAGHFGPAVIGEKQYEEEQKVVHDEKSVAFGDAVRSGSNMGRKAAPQEPAEASSEEEAWPEGYAYEQAGGYYAVTAPDGSPVESDKPSGKWQGADAARNAAWAHAEAAEAEAQAAAEAEASGETQDLLDATIEEAQEALAENPELVDELMRAEIQRPDGIRLEVIDALEEAEARKDTPREEVFETLESLRAGAEE